MTGLILLMQSCHGDSPLDQEAGNSSSLSQANPQGVDGDKTEAFASSNPENWGGQFSGHDEMVVSGHTGDTTSFMKEGACYNFSGTLVY